MARKVVFASCGLLCFALALWGLVGSACSSAPLRSLGNSRSGYESVSHKVTAEEAVRLAQPHLEESFELRKKNRPEDMKSDDPPVDHVMLKGDWYYIVRDNYWAHKSELTHAVRVHTQTGEVQEPK